MQIGEIVERLISTLQTIESEREKLDGDLVDKEMARYEQYWKPCIIVYVNN